MPADDPDQPAPAEVSEAPLAKLHPRFFPFYCALAALVTFGYAIYDGYQIDGDAFVFIDRDTARVTTIFGYPTHRLAQLG